MHSFEVEELVAGLDWVHIAADIVRIVAEEGFPAE